MTLSVQNLRLEQFEGLRVEWNRLAEENPNPFLTHEWISAWWKNFGKGKEPFFLGFKEGETWKGFLPLFVQKKGGARILEFASASDLWPDYLDIICASADREALIKEAAGFISEKISWDLFRLSHLLPEARDCFAQNLNLNSPPVEAPGGVCPFVQVQGTFEEFLNARFKKKKRYNLKRQVRVATEEENFRLYVPDHPGEETEISTFLRLHEKRAKEKGIQSSILGEAKKKFFIEIMKTLGEGGRGKLSFLKKGEEAAAAGMTFEAGGKTFFYQTGNDPAFSRLSPGTVLLTLLLEKAFSSGKKEFDFLNGDESYKDTWKTNERVLSELIYFRPSVKGTLLRLFFKIKKLLKAMLGR